MLKSFEVIARMQLWVSEPSEHRCWNAIFACNTKIVLAQGPSASKRVGNVSKKSYFEDTRKNSVAQLTTNSSSSSHQSRCPDHFELSL